MFNVNKLHHVYENTSCPPPPLLFQLDLITDLLGTPPLSALASACEGARAHILRGPHKPVGDCVIQAHTRTLTHTDTPCACSGLCDVLV